MFKDIRRSDINFFDTSKYDFMLLTKLFNDVIYDSEINSNFIHVHCHIIYLGHVLPVVTEVPAARPLKAKLMAFV